MARLRSVEKQQAILQSAVREIAEVGLGASTARIAKGAGIAEGTIFTYFASKDALLNELYLAIKTEVYERIHQSFPHRAPLQDRARHIWTEYLLWALEKPQEQTASVLLGLSPVISSETKDQLERERGVVGETLEQLSKRGSFRTLPPGFCASSMLAMQTPVLELAAQKPRISRKLIDQGFDAFWKMAE